MIYFGNKVGRFGKKWGRFGEQRERNITTGLFGLRINSDLFRSITVGFLRFFGALHTWISLIKYV
jgi:hypothetical protein